MDYAQALPTLLTVAALAYMGFIVIKGGRDFVNKLFLLFVLAISVWLLAVAILTATTWGVNDYLGRFTFAAALATVIATQAFTNSLFRIRHGRTYHFLIYGLGLAAILLTLFGPAVIEDVQVRNGLPYPVYGDIFVVYPLYLGAVIVAYFFSLFSRWRTIRNTDDLSAKRQLNAVALGIVGFTFTGLGTNLVLPAIFSDAWPSRFAPLGSLILALSFFYAISRFKLFDIRFAIIRSTTYLFILAGLALAFVLIVNVAGSRVTAFKDHESLQQIFNVAVVLALAVSFQPLKRAFDKVTNKYFFKDIYDTNEVVDKLNNILISNTDVQKLLALCERILADKLKLEFCSFWVFTDDTKQKVVGSEKTVKIPQEYADLRKEFLSQNRKIVSERNIDTTTKNMQDFFSSKEVSAIGKMISHDDIIGVVVFGNKKNGDPLTKQDLSVLNIVADQVAIAAQNLLRFKEIENFNITLQEKIEDATKELRRKNERLRLLDQTKDDFISMASHQLRTPLTSVKGYISMVLDGDAGKISPLQRKLLNQSFLSSQRMVYLISDLLNVSRLRTGKFVVEPVQTNLADVVAEEVEQLKETAKGRELKLVYKKPEHFPALMLDENKLRQVIMNFIDNAIYYTPAKGRITITLADSAESIEFTVKDNGIGVPKHEQHHLFGKFYRAHNAKRARPDGTGLGLFMAKKVIIAQGGAVIFKSQEGKGSTFGFTFPKHKLPKEADKSAGENNPADK